jgi:hypothetical protein
MVWVQFESIAIWIILWFYYFFFLCFFACLPFLSLFLPYSSVCSNPSLFLRCIYIIPPLLSSFLFLSVFFIVFLNNIIYFFLVSFSRFPLSLMILIVYFINFSISFSPLVLFCFLPIFFLPICFMFCYFCSFFNPSIFLPRSYFLTLFLSSFLFLLIFSLCFILI